MAYQTGGGLAFPHNQQSTERRSHERAVSPSLHGASRFPKHPVSAEQILKSFNTRSFKREQPDNPEAMLRIIADAVAKHEPVPFLMYWGKGLRPVLAAPEYKCLDYLASMLARVSERYEHGANMTLIFTDTHAALNGHSPESINTYYDSLVAAAEPRGFSVQKFGPLVAAADIPAVDELAAQIPPAEVLAGLSLSAAKWFKGEGTTEEGAVRYYQANMVEKQVIDRAFANTIFVTFNGSSLRSLFPDSLPIFYMYSVRHGVTDKPWFLPPDFATAAPAGAAHMALV